MAGGDSWIPEGSAPAGLSGEAWSVTEESPTAPALEDARYERRGMLGEGGMGQVFVSRDRRLRREVAFKIAKDPNQARAMMREAWVTAQLEHPAIVPIYNAGETAEGQLYYTMRLVRGRSLELTLRACTEVSERLELLPHFLDVCQAMAYAHSLGIVHRDLKPANILLGEFGETQVADWGLARPMLDPEGQWEEGPHRPGSGVMGTPRYMAPEQARGEKVEPRADVWALGMVLLEVASGRGPFQITSGEDTLKRLREGRLQELDPLLNPLPQELRAIARKCLQFHPQDRYPSARELAQDVARYLRGGRVQAHEYSTGELLGRLVRARRAPLLVGVAALFLLMLLALVSSRRIADQRDKATTALAASDINLSLALAQQAQDAQAAHARPEAEILAAHSLRYGENPLARGVLAAYARAERPYLKTELPLPPRCQQTQVFVSPARDRVLCMDESGLEVLTLPKLERLWETDLVVQRVLWTKRGEVFVLDTDYQISYLDPATGAVLSSGWSPTFMVGSGLANGDVLVYGAKVAIQMNSEAMGYASQPAWERAHPELHLELCPHTTPAVMIEDRALLRCNNGDLVWLTEDGHSGELLTSVPSALPFQSASVQGDRLLLGSITGRLTVVNWRTGQFITQLDDLNTSAVQLQSLPGSETLALVKGERGGTRIWNTHQNTWEGSLPGRPHSLSQGARPGEVFLFDTTLQVWQLPIVSKAMTVRREDGVSTVAVDPLGMYVVSGDGGGNVVVQEAGSGHQVNAFTPEANNTGASAGVVKAVSFSSDGHELVATAIASSTPTRRRGQWERTGQQVSSYRRMGALNTGMYWAAPYGRGMVLIDGDRTRSVQTPEVFEGESNTDQSIAVALTLDREIWLLDAETEESQPLFSVTNALSIDTDRLGEFLWIGDTHSLCRYRRDGAKLGCQEQHAPVLDVSLSPNEGLIAAALASGDVHIVAAEDLTELAILRGHTHRTVTVAWAPDSSWLVSGSWDKSVRYWDLKLQTFEADQLVHDLEQAWSMTLDQALSRH